MLALRRAGDNDVRWLAASQGEQIDSHPARLSGQQEIDGSTLSWADLHGEVFVVTGPVLESELPTIGPSGVSVPAYYYKVVVDLRPPGVEGVGGILPNGSANQSIGRYVVSIDSVEAITTH